MNITSAEHQRRLPFAKDRITKSIKYNKINKTRIKTKFKDYFSEDTERLTFCSSSDHLSFKLVTSNVPLSNVV